MDQEMSRIASPHDTGALRAHQPVAEQAERFDDRMAGVLRVDAPLGFDLVHHETEREASGVGRLDGTVDQPVRDAQETVEGRRILPPEQAQGFQHSADRCPVGLEPELGLRPEVVGDAGYLIDPWKEEEMMGAIFKMEKDSKCREELRAKGRERIKSFSWSEAAERTAKIYEEVLSK